MCVHTYTYIYLFLFFILEHIFKNDLFTFTLNIVSSGLEVESPAPVPVKKTPSAPLLGDKYNIKPTVLKRPK